MSPGLEPPVIAEAPKQQSGPATLADDGTIVLPAHELE